MIGYILLVVLACIIIGIIMRQYIIRSLQLSEGVEIIRGTCRLKSGYGLLDKETGNHL